MKISKQPYCAKKHAEAWRAIARAQLLKRSSLAVRKKRYEEAMKRAEEIERGIS